MVRQLSTTRTRGWKAALATFVAAGAVAWHIMACIESPMSFSPSGDLAFVVMEPYGDDDQELDGLELMGERFYRLMVLTSERELREIERTSTHMLTAPAYSPDGEQFVYLRLPLITSEDERRIKEFIRNRKQQFSQATSGLTAEKWIFVAPEDFLAENPQDGIENWDPNWDGARLPQLDQIETFLLRQQAGGGLIPVELVVRQASTGELIQSLPLRIPVFAAGGDSLSSTYAFSYLLTRPQYSPDGGWVYFVINGMAMAASPSTEEVRVVSTGVMQALLSPDGETLATFSDGNLGFLKTDGQRSAYTRISSNDQFNPAAWAGNERLLVLEMDNMDLDIYDAEGHHLRSDSLPDAVDNGGEAGELAVSPDGEYMAISHGKGAHFLTSNGEVLDSWHGGENKVALVQPTFTPDSRQVAFKLFTLDETEDEKWMGTSAIVFFTPEGREVFRVPIPRIPDDERPAPTAPVTEEPQQ